MLYKALKAVVAGIKYYPVITAFLASNASMASIASAAFF